MSLEKWAEYGWLRAESSSPEEIRDLLGLITRDLKDASVDAISDDLRFQAAFSAALTAANSALRASGYRTRIQVGHHQRTIESLELTLKSDSQLIQKLKIFSKKRNATSYDASGNISKGDLQEAISVAEELRQKLTAWIEKNHPDLLIILQEACRGGS